MGYETKEKKVSTDLEQEAAEKQEIKQETANKEDTKEQTKNPVDTEKKSTQENETQKKKSRKGLIISIVAAVLICGMLLLAYFGGVYYYKGHFFPRTSINGVDCGNQEAVQAIEAVQQWYTGGYALKIVNEKGEEQLVIKPEDCEMKFSVEQSIEQLLENQNEYAWIAVMFNGASVAHEISVEAVYNEEALQRSLQGAVLFTNKGEEPQDAYISDYQAEGGYIIVAEREGTLLDKDQTILCIEEALNVMQGELNLREAQCYVRPEVVSDNAKLQEKLEQLNRIVGTRITYDWNGNEVILDGEIIHTWIIEENGEISLDEELIADYVAENAKAYDTYGQKREFTTTLGVELTLASGAYGWRTDRAAEAEVLKELILEGAVIEREPEYKNQGWVKGADDIGDSYVEIDLTNQHLYLYQDGEIVLETDFVSGNVSNGNATPPGVFGLTYKTTDAVLRGDTYETPVKYWMPFNGNIGMHDATWRRAFGGEIYLTNGSHGCINLPLNKAKEIYSYVSTGFPVICYYY
ncbi:MAG: peptidoglycan binding domain-containing protein [Lachnospiraceae bacterium]|nr:peptidoglycan binding domain-containing protein [Lachnospiraceae bacterium]